MTLDYETDSKLKALAPVIDEYAEWFPNITKRIFFASFFKTQDSLPAPEKFSHWEEEARKYDFIEHVILDDLKKLYEELNVVSVGLTAKALQGNEEITFQEYDDLSNLYENMIFKLRRLEQDCALVDSGLDIDTGLRSKKAMDADLKRELERLARKGNPLTLALAKIDNYDVLSKQLSNEQKKHVFTVLGKLIKKCIRAFDDAYRSGDGEFVMSLKHSQAVGGTAAVNRFRAFLAKEKLTVNIDGEDKLITMSYCVAEPVPGETQERLLDDMRLDLKKWEDEEDQALEYHEQSPLARYIGDKE